MLEKKLPKPIYLLAVLLIGVGLAGVISRLLEPPGGDYPLLIFGYFAFIPPASVSFAAGMLSLMIWRRGKENWKRDYLIFLTVGLAISILFWEALLLWENFKYEVFMLFMWWGGIVTLFFVTSQLQIVKRFKYAYPAILFIFSCCLGLLPPLRDTFLMLVLVLMPSVLIPPYLVMRYYQERGT